MEIRNFAANTNHIVNDKSNSKDLSVNDFLQIMAAEMKNQSPFGGGEGGGGSKTDYIAQMAQFTMLEQMGAITESLNVLAMMNQQQYTIGLIGKEVNVMDGDQELTGLVEKVKFQDGYAVAQVNGKSYNLGSIIGIANVEKADSISNSEAVDIILEALENQGIGQGYPGYENIDEDHGDEFPEEGPIGETGLEVSE